MTAARNNPWRTDKPFGIMGIVNVTPDSFSDGGRSIRDCIAHGVKLARAGAHILDIGGESTRPGAEPTPPDDERLRIGQVIEELAALLPDTPLSVDTRNASTAAWACEHGAAIINDVSGLRHDGGMIEILANYKPGYVLVHSIGTPQTMQVDPAYDDIVEEVLFFFESALNHLVKKGIPEQNIILDPGIGFGKTLRHNLQLLNGAAKFLALGRPLLAGISMKSLFGDLLCLTLADRRIPTAVATALLWEKGFFWHRVHDAAAAKIALALAGALGDPASISSH